MRFLVEVIDLLRHELSLETHDTLTRTNLKHVRTVETYEASGKPDVSDSRAGRPSAGIVQDWISI